MRRLAPTKSQGIKMAKTLKMLLRKHGIPVQDVLLFGSVASNRTHNLSDIDIAVVHAPFKSTRSEELRELCRAERGSNLHSIEVVYFHPEDLNDKYSTLVQEVQKHGISV